MVSGNLRILFTKSPNLTSRFPRLATDSFPSSVPSGQDRESENQHRTNMKPVSLSDPHPNKCITPCKRLHRDSDLKIPSLFLKAAKGTMYVLHYSTKPSIFIFRGLDMGQSRQE